MKRQLDEFNKTLFTPIEASTRLSFSPAKMALVVTSNLTSPPLPVHEKLKQIPFFSSPIKTKVTHYIGIVSHVGTIEVLGSNVRTDFQVIDNQTITFQSSEFNYKDLGEELNIGAMSGKLNTVGNSNLSLSNLEYKNNKFQMSVSGLQLDFSGAEKTASFKANELSVNGIKLSAPVGNVNKQGDLTKLSFKAQYGSETINVDQTTEKPNGAIPFTYGSYLIPNKLIDDVLDPGLNAALDIQQKALLESKDSRKILLFNITKEINKNSLKMKTLQSFAHSRHISRDGELIKIIIPKEESMEKSSKNAKDFKIAQEKADEWIKEGGDKTFEKAIYSLQFTYDFFITTAAEIILHRLEKSHANDPFYNLLKARVIIKKGYLSGMNWDPKSIATAQEIISKTNTDNKIVDLIKFKIAHINNDKTNREVHLQKFLSREQDPVIKSLVQAENLKREDPKMALSYLEEAHKVDPNHYIMTNYLREKVNLYGQLQDTASQDALYKELVSLPDPHIYDLINYSGILLHQKRYQEAKPIVEKCYAKTGPNNFCHTYYQTITVKLAYDKFLANDVSGATKDIENLLITHPVNMGAYFVLGAIYHKTDLNKATAYYSVSCSLGSGDGCLYAADKNYYEKKDLEASIPFYELACEKNVILGCTKLGFRLEEKGHPEVAQNYYKKSCLDLKDSIGCYHLGRVMYLQKSPKDDVANYLDISCKSFQEVCPLSTMIRSGKMVQLPQHPPGPLAKTSP